MNDSQDNNRLISGNDFWSPPITPQQGETLLHLARSSITQYLLHGQFPDPGAHPNAEGSTSGIFVTLWQTQGMTSTAVTMEEPALRGCIGHLQSELPLELLVQQVAIAAATRDPRFPPLSVAELKTTSIEIAILSPLRLVTDLRQVKIGLDGLMIEGLGKRGLLLPKVAVRMGWDRAAFLDNVCRKAGLPLNCWPKACQLYAFTTVVFDEQNGL